MVRTDPSARFALIGRALLALIVVLSGAAKLASTGVLAGHLASDGLPLDTVPAVVLGVFEIAAGSLLGVGYRTRAAALLLALFALVTAFVFHPFWAVPPELEFVQQLLFVKNLTMFGALIVVAGSALSVQPALSRLPGNTRGTRAA